ncbi:MAG: winged helix-turn-helix transcriptional regulator [Candidatus Micrarchaeaceae archaeon]
MPDYKVTSAFNERQSLTLRRVARALSEDSRLSVSDISKRLSLSRKTVSDKMKQLEKDFGAKYTIEFDERLLGIVHPHLTMVKFERKPDIEHIKEILRSSEIPQVAATVNGTYDLFIYSNYFSDSEYAKWDKKIRIELSEYGAEWNTSAVVHKQLGFFPLRNEIVEKSSLSDRYKAMIKLLNDNARISFAELSTKMNMHFNTVAYNFGRLLRKGYIKRFTLVMDIPKDVTIMTFFSKYSVLKGYESASAKARKAFMDDDADSLISRYLITAPLIGSYDFFTMGAFDSEKAALEHDILYHKSLFSDYKINIEYGVVDKVLLGRLPVRSIDTKSEYRTIYWE